MLLYTKLLSPSKKLLFHWLTTSLFNNRNIVMKCRWLIVNKIYLLYYTELMINFLLTTSEWQYWLTHLSSALMLAVEKENNDLVRFLIEREADVNAISKNFQKETSLSRAAKAQNKELVRVLVEKGAEIQVSWRHHLGILLALSRYFTGVIKVFYWRYLGIDNWHYLCRLLALFM